MKLPFSIRKRIGSFQTGGTPFNPVGPAPTSLFEYKPGPALEAPFNNDDFYKIPEENRSDFQVQQGAPVPEQKTPSNWMDMARDAMYIGNPLLRGLSEYNARGQQDDYLQSNLANPLANLAYNDGRSDGVKYGYEQFQTGGTSYRPVPQPSYSLSPLATPTKDDSASYKSNFEDILKWDPIAWKQMNDFGRYGIPMQGPNGQTDKKQYVYDSNKQAAYEDASSALLKRMLNTSDYDKYATGKLEKGGIHIKPENRGKFTEYKKRTGKTTEEALHSKDPHVRQMANFARNAKKWHHKMGGSQKYRGKC
jgi:hypothetical protein